MIQFSSRGLRNAPVKNTRSMCTTIAAMNSSAAQWCICRMIRPPRTSNERFSVVSYARDIVDALQRHVAAVVADLLHRRVEEQRQERAGQQQHDERVERDLAEQERPVVREDLVEQAAAAAWPPAAGRRSRVARRARQSRSVNLAASSRPLPEARADRHLVVDSRRTKNPSSSDVKGSIGSRRVAGPKIGRALSVMLNCDWWHGQSRRLVCCS